MVGDGLADNTPDQELVPKRRNDGSMIRVADSKLNLAHTDAQFLDRVAAIPRRHDDIPLLGSIGEIDNQDVARVDPEIPHGVAGGLHEEGVQRLADASGRQIHILPHAVFRAAGKAKLRSCVEKLAYINEPVALPMDTRVHASF